MADEYLAMAKQAAEKAGKLIRDAHNTRAFSVDDKNNQNAQRHVDLVTEIDKAAEQVIIETLKQRFPNHNFIGEESAQMHLDQPLILDPSPTWIIDPLDGTTNFVHGYHLVTVSIALAINGQLLLGVIYNPLLDMMCSAIQGRGATLNGQPIQVSAAKNVKEAVIVNNMGVSREPGVNALCTARLYALLEESVRGLRNSGSAAQNMMDVACGRLDAYFEDGFGGPWDVAAGVVIVEEAGGVCRMVLGEPFSLRAGKGQVLCGNPQVVEDVARILRAVK